VGPRAGLDNKRFEAFIYVFIINSFPFTQPRTPPSRRNVTPTTSRNNDCMDHDLGLLTEQQQNGADAAEIIFVCTNMSYRNQTSRE
jgi:hypothetical protein